MITLFSHSILIILCLDNEDNSTPSPEKVVRRSSGYVNMHQPRQSVLSTPNEKLCIIYKSN